MKILFLASYLPYPLFDGGAVRLYNLLKFLSEKHEVTLVCEKREYQSQADVSEVARICKKVVVYSRPKAISPRNIVKASLSANSLLLTVHTHKELTYLIEKELKAQDFDLIHVETFYVMQNLPKTQIPIVLVEHNIEYSVYEKYAKKASLILRPLLMIEAAKIKRAEVKAWGSVAALVAVSPKEQKIMGPGTLLVPNGVDTAKFALKKFDMGKKEKRVLFIGNFKWIQNRDSVTYIIKNIWPGVISKNSSVKLWVVGKNIPESIKKLGNPKIIFDENAPDQTERIFQEADLLLSPIRVGGGTNFKILESMSCGTPVVTNSLGNEGLRARDKSEILICEEPLEFTNTISNILTDGYLYEKISRNARKFVEQNYDWKMIASKLDNIYESLHK